jgi:hypothetical protein
MDNETEQPGMWSWYQNDQQVKQNKKQEGHFSVVIYSQSAFDKWV